MRTHFLVFFFTSSFLIAEDLNYKKINELNSKFFQSDELKHDLNSHFNPPGLTNFIGVAQADNDLTGVRGLNFPPFGTSLNRTCGLY